tara:strand:- start:2416 stop:2871 length:456 start_codon:yes stop_codon:yes gene_type:complete
MKYLPKLKIYYLFLLPLFIGFFIYASCRNSHFLYERIFNILKISQWEFLKIIISSQCPFPYPENIFQKVFVYSLPNALWVFSSCILIRHYLLVSTRQIIFRRKLLYFIVAIGPELLQLLKIIPGTYDTYDVFLSLIITLSVDPVYKYFMID